MTFKKFPNSYLREFAGSSNMPDDSDIVFEGSQDDQRDYAEDLDLFAISTFTKPLWELPECSAVHRAIEILIRKGLNWDHSQAIMSRINASIGNRDISQANFTMRDETLKKWGLSNDKIAGIRKILALPEVTGSTLCAIKEGGIYLVRMFKILHGEQDDVPFPDDYNLKQCLGILFYRQRAMTPQDMMEISKTWNGYRSQIAYFLHRLKPEAVAKIQDDQDLEPWDFWGCVAPQTAR